jgi:hypothetical protein
MTKEQVLLAIAGVLIVIGLCVIVSALRRARRREHARDRVNALLDLCAEPLAPEPVLDEEDAWDQPFREPAIFEPVGPVMAPVRAALAPIRPATGPVRPPTAQVRPAIAPARRPMAPAGPVMAPVRPATGHRYVVTLSDTSGSFGVRPEFDRGQTLV